MKKFVLFIAGALYLLNTQAQVGSSDPSFGTNGVKIYQADANIAPGILKVLTGPGKEQYVIYSAYGSQYPRIFIGKYLSDGTPDASYGNGGYSDPLVIRFADAALQKDGRLVIAGSTVYNYYPRIQDDLLVARYNTNGTPDQSFNQTGVVTKTYTAFSYEFARSVTIGDHYIAVGGYSASLVGDFAFFHVDVLDMNGGFAGSIQTSDLIMGLQNFNPAYYHNSIAMQGDKIIVAATEPDLTGAGNFFSLQRYFADGTPDNSFGQQGITTAGNDFFNGNTEVTTQGDRILVTSFSHNLVTDQYGFAVGRYNNDGSIDNSFNGNGRQVTNFGAGTPVAPTAIISRGDTIYVGGTLYNPTTNRLDFALARYRGNGSLDNNFDLDGKQVTGSPSYSFLLEDMAVLGNRLAVTGRANAAGINAGVAAQYILEDYIVLACPKDTVLPTAKGLCAAVVNGIDPVVVAGTGYADIRYMLSGATTVLGQSTASGQTFNKGITQVTYTTTTDATKACTFLVTVEDKEAPVISQAIVLPPIVWPANHTMRLVAIGYVATDNCSGVTTVLSVSSSEPDANTDKHDVPGDWQVIDGHFVKLRAEYSSKGNGRIYTITIKATDAAGNITSKKVTVSVPTSLFNKKDKPGNDDDEGTGGPHALQVKTLSNPSTTYFTLLTQSVSKEKMSLRVVNQLGAVVETRSNIPANSTLQIGHTYREGMYIAEIVQGNKRVQLKLIKLK
ncbi:MAG: T9SS type A sorting domain-containing protein [Ferruginibacter sp.]